jgi:hypothetical protein
VHGRARRSGVALGFELRDTDNQRVSMSAAGFLLVDVAALPLSVQKP